MFVFLKGFLLPSLFSSSQSQSSYIIRNPQQRRISQSQPVRGRDEEQDDIVSADVEEVIIVIVFNAQCCMYFKTNTGLG